MWLAAPTCRLRACSESNPYIKVLGRLTMLRHVQELSSIINFSRDIEELQGAGEAPKGIRKLSIAGGDLERTKHRELVELYRC